MEHSSLITTCRLDIRPETLETATQENWFWDWDQVSRLHHWTVLAKVTTEQGWGVFQGSHKCNSKNPQEQYQKSPILWWCSIKPERHDKLKNRTKYDLLNKVKWLILHICKLFRKSWTRVGVYHAGSIWSQSHFLYLPTYCSEWPKMSSPNLSSAFHFQLWWCLNY